MGQIQRGSRSGAMEIIHVNLNEYQLKICKEFWCCITSVETLLLKAFDHEVYPACPDVCVSSLASSREQRAGPRSRTLQILRVCRVLSVWPSSPLQPSRYQQEGPASLRHLRGRRSTLRGPHPQFPPIATPATVILPKSICEPSPRGCFACGSTSSVVGSAARLVGVVTLS